MIFNIGDIVKIKPNTPTEKLVDEWYGLDKNTLYEIEQSSQLQVGWVWAKTYNNPHNFRDLLLKEDHLLPYKTTHDIILPDDLFTI